MSLLISIGDEQIKISSLFYRLSCRRCSTCMCVRKDVCDTKHVVYVVFMVPYTVNDTVVKKNYFSSTLSVYFERIQKSLDTQ